MEGGQKLVQAPPMIRREVLLRCLAGVVLALPSTAAHACRAPSDQKPYLRSSLPALSADMIAAKVEILTDTRSLRDVRIEARLITMLQGAYAEKRLRIEPVFVTSCDAFPRAGEQGIIVGKVLRRDKGVLVIDVVRAPSLNELRRLAPLQR
jgi:hypothetical protein